MTELKPCPFCGGKPERYSGLRRHGFDRAIECTNPACGMFLVGDDAAWNRRPLEEALEVRVKELEAAAVQWITYDGTPETLPERGRLVIICVEDTLRVSCLCEEDDDDALEWDMEVCTWSVEEGHLWAYLPLPSTISKKNFTK